MAVVAVDALQMMGPGRYAGRPAILRELRTLAAESKYEPLRKKSADLIKMAK